MNYVDKGNSKFSQFQREQGVDDSNMFVTSFVLYGLLEAEEMGTLKIDQHRFSQALEAMSEFRDKNSQTGIPQYSFWEQVDSQGIWMAAPNNLLNIVKVLPDFPEPIAKLLNRIGFGIFTSAKEMAQAFTIPPDNDDSSVNLALLAFLRETNSSHYEFWRSKNHRINEYYSQALKYAYRPFGAN